MGLFDYFTTEGKMKRHIRRLTNRDALPEDREASALWLADEGSARSLLGMLQRFDMNLTQHLLDGKEKDFVFATLVGIGAPVERPLRAWLKRCKQLPLPLRLLVEMKGSEAAFDSVFTLLAAELGKDDFKTERKKCMLVWLSERRHDRIVEEVSPFLADFDEEVRYRAAEAIIAQDDDRSRDALLAAMISPDEESNRVPVRIAEIFAARRWTLTAEEVGDRMPPGYAIRSGRLVAT